MATSDEQRAPRFFIDHGIIHDRMSEKHLRTVLGDGPAFDAEVHETLAELNQLDEEVAHVAARLVELMRDQVFQQAPQVRADEPVRIALRNLAAEVGGLLGMQDASLREIHGNTNINILARRLNEADAALAANPQQSNERTELMGENVAPLTAGPVVGEPEDTFREMPVEQCDVTGGERPASNPQQIASETKEQDRG